MTTRTGKIARLPKAVRDELNQRLDDGAAGPAVLDWLNGLPAVREILAKEFAGVPVSKQNLGAWREGGYTEWVTGQEMARMVQGLAEHAGDLAAAGGGKLAEHLGVVIAARYAMVLAKWNGEVTPEFEAQIGVLRRLGQEVTRLRRCEFDRDRLELKRARDEFVREKTANDVAMLFEQWLESPNMGDILELKKISFEERIRRFYRIFDMYIPVLGRTQSYGEQEGPPTDVVPDPAKAESRKPGEAGEKVEGRSMNDETGGQAPVQPGQGESSQVKAGQGHGGTATEGEAGPSGENIEFPTPNPEQPMTETPVAEVGPAVAPVPETEEERNLRLEQEAAKRQREEWLWQKAEREGWWEAIKDKVAPVVEVHQKPTGDIMGPCDPPAQFESKLGPYRILGKGAPF